MRVKKATKKTIAPRRVSGKADTGAEGEDDLIHLNGDKFRQLAIGGTDWTIETLIGQIRKKNLRLDPEFQRRDAWTDDRRSKFIESCVLGLPIPQLVLAEDKKNAGQFIVIDGKQRLLSLAQFAELDTGYPLPKLVLSDLNVRADLNGITLKDLVNSTETKKQADLNTFYNHTIRTVLLKNWPDEETLWLIFLRLNTSSVALAPQELRQALHPGPFVKYANDYSKKSQAIRTALGLSRPDFRMRDVELFIRYIGFRTRLSKYAGNMKEFLDSTCKDYNGSWEGARDTVESEAVKLELGVSVVTEIFGNESAFRIWRGDKYERVFNRTVFDIMLYYLADKKAATKAMNKKRAIVNAFCSLCDKDEDFVRSLEITTKSIDATAERLTKWGNALQKILGSTVVKVPVRTGNRFEV